jgi:uncharacterized membrane protein
MGSKVVGMFARLRHFASQLADSFWLVPAGCVVAGGLLALGCVALDLRGSLPRALLESAWLYNGGATGARTLLGAVAGSSIGVAGTVFSITIAALTLAAGQMGPRLLRNFVRDRGNQATLGVLLGTFTYALMVLRSVRAADEGGGFTPHLAMTVGIVLALCSVAMLIYFVGHVASRINVDTVIGLVGDDLQRSMRSFGGKETPERDAAPGPAVDPVDFRLAAPVRLRGGGYLQRVDTEGLLDWAAENDARLQLTVRPGHYVFPGSIAAWLTPATLDARGTLDAALVLGPDRTPYEDVEYAIRQLVEVAMRALSPGINDPYSAISVVDRLGSALCELVEVRLPSGRCERDGQLRLTIPAVDYDGLTDTMFHPLRQCASGSAMVLIRLVEVLGAVAACEQDAARLASLRRHGDLVMAEAIRSIRSPEDLADVRARHETLGRINPAAPAVRVAAA